MKSLLLISALTIFSFTSNATEDTSNKSVTPAKPNMTLSQKETWTNLLGKWYGKQPTTDGRVREELVERFPGVYKVTFRTYDKSGHHEDEVEMGLWGVAGPVYFSFFQGWLRDGQFVQADPRDPNNADAYNIISLDSDTFVYKGIATGNEFTLKKVTDNFTLKD